LREQVFQNWKNSFQLIQIPPLEKLIVKTGFLDKMSRYLNKIVIVTGGSQGIGEGCSRVFVANGAKVVACALGENDGDKLGEELNQNGKLFVWSFSYQFVQSAIR